MSSNVVVIGALRVNIGPATCSIIISRNPVNISNRVKRFSESLPVNSFLYHNKCFVIILHHVVLFKQLFASHVQVS